MLPIDRKMRNNKLRLKIKHDITLVTRLTVSKKKSWRDDGIGMVNLK